MLAKFVPLYKITYLPIREDMLGLGLIYNTKFAILVTL